MWDSVALPPALHLPRGRPSGPWRPSPSQAAVRRERKRGRATAHSSPRNLLSPTDSWSSHSPAILLSPPSYQFSDL